ncbi:SixA phosphatase family protein [Sungkyunkwania multivorans]|uniref:SixA phosphatase family protein n=1 Tax=Sungkyunkwania multivorans TaxID=1173618 RepID=A0ABW3CX12_9FLAO
MKKLCMLVALLAFAVGGYAQDEDITTFYFIRHAEKDRTDPENRDPYLTEAGRQRAKKWASTFRSTTFDAVYSTKYRRTMETARPTAENNDLEIKIYDPKHIDAASFAKENAGKTILVVGHSNTTPMFVNQILGEKKFEAMDDNDNASLFVLIMADKKLKVTRLHIE